VRNVYACLRNALNTAVRLKKLAVNPCLGAKPPQPAKGEMLHLAPLEVEALASKIDPHFRTLIYAAAYTGLRAGELGGLRRQDLDLEAPVPTLRVEQALMELNGHVSFTAPKSESSARELVLPEFLADMLREHCDGLEADELVFQSKTGQPLRHNLFYRRHFRATVVGDPEKKVEPAPPEHLHGLRFHDLRHTCGTALGEEGFSEHEIAAWLGHSRKGVTARYVHVSKTRIVAMAKALHSRRLAGLAPAENVVELRPAEGSAGS
jgi:integrase